ncbi:DUF4397 domain-containing protein [Pedobacter gandavensis]|uniref:DUF4397 domain-containing protein n=1 Tax=Pedobacter gandavensis TaxID=2679963 RepID=A0ABR6EYR4_9SPHI|nr:DUF4397 domain-containing protein [Pedobacter gandavensis]MBB2150423.1 DUF4397 domain-containing protein [Pedobacter gandavensis]
MLNTFHMNLSTIKITGNFNKMMTGALLTMSTLFLTACSTKETPVPESSSMMFVNTSPTPATYNVYVNNGLASPGALPFGGAMSYLKLNTGEQSIKFTTASSSESLITKKITLENNKAYSLFLIGKEDKLDYLVINDLITKMPVDKAMIRFINLTPDATSLELGIKEGATLIGDKAYKENSDFIDVEAKKLTLQIKEKGTGLVISELVDTEFKAGSIYTILSIGMVTPTGQEQKATAKLVNN